MQICHCGTQAGYPHDAACPFPLFTDDDASVERWSRERAALVDGTAECGAAFADGAYGAQRCARVPGHPGRHGTTTRSRLRGLA